MAANPVISCAGLVKTFGSTRALDGLDLSVETGEVHGFLGPNGAGKTVTLRIFLGLLRPDAGTARLFGADPWSDAVELHRRLAYVPGETSLWPNLTGGEIIDILGGLRGGLVPARRAELVDRFELDLGKKARTYSKGNRQKVVLVAALAADVELLLLDEPTAGLDPLMEAEFQDCIFEARQRGCTVLLSSHILAEVERLCDRVTIIRDGRTVQSGRLSELRQLTRTSFVVATERSPTAIAEIEGVHGFELDGHEARFDVDADSVDEAVRALAPLGVSALLSRPPTLEQLFLRHYAGDEEPSTRAPHASGDSAGERS